MSSMTCLGPGGTYCMFAYYKNYYIEMLTTAIK